jgi:hypothetical protein
MSRPALPQLAYLFQVLADFFGKESKSAELFLAELPSHDGVAGFFFFDLSDGNEGDRHTSSNGGMCFPDLGLPQQHARLNW